MQHGVNDLGNENLVQVIYIYRSSCFIIVVYQFVAILVIQLYEYDSTANKNISILFMTHLVLTIDGAIP